MGLDLTGVGAAFTFLNGVLDRVIPDKAAAAAAKLQLLQVTQSGDLAKLQAETQVELAQAGTNTAEASSSDPFARDWRPFVGWTCGAALAYDFVARPLLAWASTCYKIPVPPELDLATLLPLMGSLLGVGAIQLTHAINKGT